MLSSQFAGNVLARLDKNEILNEKNFWDAITFGKGKYTFPRDEEFKKALANENLYVNIESDGCKYFLYSLEKFNGADLLPAYSKAVVEHIIPQRLNATWRSYLQGQNDFQSHEYLVQTLGNLALIVDAEKSESESFEEKKVRFANSNFAYTKEIANYSTITSKQIQARAKKLANVAIRIWTLPEKYNAESKILEKVYNLDSDFGIFTGTKPATVSMLNVEKKVSTWKALIVEVIKQLNSLDMATFRLATRENNVARFFSAVPKNLRDAYEIDNELYMEGNFDTIHRLKILNNFVENFDRMLGTNIKDEIWFTLKK